MKILLICFSLQILFFYVGCSHQENMKENYISIKELKLNSWMNLMPGGQPSFHISGEVRIKNGESIDITNLKLESINVFQNSELLGSLKPDFNIKNENEDNIIPVDSERSYFFKAKMPSKVITNFNEDEPVNMKFLFRWADKSYLHDIENVKVQKVY